MPIFYALAVQSKDVTTTKAACDAGGILNPTRKIFQGSTLSSPKRFIVPTCVLHDRSTLTEASRSTRRDNVPAKLDSTLRNLERDAVFVDIYVFETAAETELKQRRQFHPLRAALMIAFARVRNDFAPHLAEWQGLVPDCFSTAYAIYPPMLLLPSAWYANKTHHNFFESLKNAGQQISNNAGHAVELFFEEVCNELGVTHVAVNAAIPSHVTNDAAEENRIRSPLNFSPVHGDFGPSLPAYPDYVPGEADFNAAFWVSSRQNGITQVWAPRYTMFSSGNVSEKIRIAKLETVQRAVTDGQESGLGCTAVDLFAGIGYFAFSYAKAGVSKVLCWDLNPWSVEGLRRGADLNKMTVKLVDTNDETAGKAGMLSSANDTETTFLVFQESNSFARRRISDLRRHIPPIRHVNCGMLPTVGEAWKVAVEAIDPEIGGWIHLHETVHDASLQVRAIEINNSISEYLDELYSVPHIAQLMHIEKVKSIAPRFTHVVLDIEISLAINYQGSK